ncbi:MAG: hypothetical protein ABR583_01910 [Gaiellaceae bacterium]
MVLCTVGVAAFLAARLTAWPPHEDETLALFIGRRSLGDVLATVQGERGGAPLHFMLAWAVREGGGGLAALRLVSALFAVASVPTVALLGARLASRSVALAATVLVSASWMLLFHGVYGRMYSLFLFLAALSYLALLAAVDGGGARRWAVWGLAALATASAHPYGALSLAAQGAFVLVIRERVREAMVAFGAVAVAGIPFWYTDVVLARRLEVGLGGGGERLDGPLDVLVYLGRTVGDFSAGWWPAIAGVAALAVVGARSLRTTHATAAAATALAVPAAALLVGRAGSAASPETRHLIFALPLVALLVAAGIATAARRPGFAAAAVAALAAVELAWGYAKTPELYRGEASARSAARAEASHWLARTARPDDVLFGYDPLFLGAWERDSGFPATVVPRADAKLALAALEEAPRPLGRGVWVLDASDTANADTRLTIERRLPHPTAMFEARVFGPFLVVRTRGPSLTPVAYLAATRSVMLTGRELDIADAFVNLSTAERALERLDRSSRQAIRAPRTARRG